MSGRMFTPDRPALPLWAEILLCISSSVAIAAALYALLFIAFVLGG